MVRNLPYPAGTQHPPALRAYKELAPPPGYIERRRWNVAMLAGGGIVLGTTYGASVGYAGSQNFENGLGALAVPVLGPWIALGNRDFNCEVDAGADVDTIADSQKSLEACIANQTAAAGFLVGFGVGQLFGAALFFVGILDSRRTWVRADLAGIQWELDGGATPGLSGLSVTGRF